jgi:hypothetical protein
MIAVQETAVINVKPVNGFASRIMPDNFFDIPIVIGTVVKGSFYNGG